MNTLLAITLQAALLAAIVFALTKLAARWIPPAWRAALWFLVIARLLIPIAPPSPLSLQNFFTSAPAPIEQPSILKGVPRIEIAGPIATGNELVYTADINTVAAPAPAPFPWRRFFIALWVIGAAASLAILFARALILRRRLAKSNVPPPPQTLHILQGCRDELNLRYPVRVSVSSEIAAPALTGLLPARLIIPANSETLTFAELRHIFLHELAHIKLGHLAFHWLSLLARCLHWFNPIAHFAASRLRHECELAADAAALARIAEPDRPAYGQTILDSLARATTAHSPLSLAMANHTRHIEQRLQSLNNLATTRLQTVVGAILLIILTACGLTGPKQATTQIEPTVPPAVRPEQTLAEPPVGDPLLAANPNNRFLVSRRFRVADPAALIARVTDERGRKSRFPVQSHLQSVIEQNPAVQAERKTNQIRHDDRALLFDEETGIISARLTETELDVLVKELVRLFASDAQNPNSASQTEAYSVLTNSVGPFPAVSGRAKRISVIAAETEASLDTIRIDGSKFQNATTFDAVLKELRQQLRAAGSNIDLGRAATLTDIPAGKDFTMNLPSLPNSISLRYFLELIVANARPPAYRPQTSRLAWSVRQNAIVFSVEEQSDAAAPEPFRAEMLDIPGAISKTNILLHSEARKELLLRLYIPLIDASKFREPRTLKTLMWELTRITRESDPKGKPIEFLMGPDSPEFLITIRNLEGRCSIREFLDYIVAGATPPAGATPGAKLQCSVEDHGVFFSVTSAADKVQTRFFQLPAGQDLPEDLKSFLKAITSGNTRTFFYSKNKGVLSVRAWEDHLDELQERIEAAAREKTPAPELLTRGFKIPVIAPEKNAPESSTDLPAFLKAIEAEARLNKPYVDSDADVARKVNESRRKAFAGLTNVLMTISSTQPAKPPGGHFQNSKSWFFHPHTGALFVRATSDDLDKIEQGLSSLNAPVKAEQQVTFRAQILEMPISVAQELLKDLKPSRDFASTNEVIVINDSGNKQVKDLALSGSQNLLENVKEPVTSTNVTTPGQEFYVSPSRMKELLEKATKTKGVDQISAPILTTVIGRQARISIEDTVTVMTPKTFPTGEKIPFGPVVDVIATEFDGEKLAYTTKLTLTEFLGYTPYEGNEKPLPRFRVRELNAKTKVQPGLTHLFSASLPEGSGTTNIAKVALFMITPTLVDGVGNIAFPEKHAK